jgi:hypothetical protein
MTVGVTLTVEGYLDQHPVPGDLHGTTAQCRLVLTPSDSILDDAVLPCTITDPLIARAILHDLEPGDLLRVQGVLTLDSPGEGPGEAATRLRLAVLSVEVPDQPAPASRAGSLEPLDAPPPTAVPTAVGWHGRYVTVTTTPDEPVTVWTETGAPVGTALPDGIDALIRDHEQRPHT